MVIGRASDCDWRLESAQVSRGHAVLVQHGSTWHIRDTGSRNGLYVNGEACCDAALAHGALIRVGEYLLLFQELDAAQVEVLELTPPHVPELAGNSPQLLQIKHVIKRIGPSQQPVLITGEAGVGKQQAAKALHRHYCQTQHRPFVSINCSALSGTLAEAELFGHVKGAFNGAYSDGKGLLQQANGGTLFLDELEQLSRPLQLKLLGFLKTGRVTPAGTRQSLNVNVRLLAATSGSSDVKGSPTNSLLPELYAQFTDSAVHLVPLHERKEDIWPVALHLLKDLGVGNTVPDTSAMEALLLHRFRFNAREVRHMLCHALQNTDAQLGHLSLEDLPSGIRGPLQARQDGIRSAQSAQVQRPLPGAGKSHTPTEAALRAALNGCSGNVSQVAAFFGRDQTQICSWCDRFGINMSH